MSRILQLVTLMFLSMFVFVEVAQAGLIRNGGRGELSRVYKQTVYYVNDQFNNAGGIDDTLLDPPAFFGGGFTSQLAPQSAQAFINGDNNPISAFPGGEGCTRGYEQQIVDDARERIDFLEGVGSNRTQFEEEELAEQLAFIALVEVNDPCKWQFEQGEAISVEGLFQFVFTGFLANEVDYAVNWEIDGVSHAGEIGLVDGQSFAGVTLNKLINLAPGEYDISASVRVTSDKGKFYYTTPESTNGEVTAVSFEANVCAANPNYISPEAFEATFRNANPAATDDNVSDAINDIYYADRNISDDTQCGYNSVVQDSFRGTLNPTVFNFNQLETFNTFKETLIITARGNNDPVVEASAPASIGTFLTGIFVLGLMRRRKLIAQG